MRDDAVNALIEMGMPSNIKGFKYIVDSMEIFKSDEVRNGKIMNTYSIVAKRNNTTSARVERAIRHAFSLILTDGYAKAVEKYLTRKKTTNGNLLHTFYIRLEQEVKNEN